MTFWLMKTEPSVFSFEDLVRAPQHTASWDGVRNYQARNLMRDGFALQDHVFIYHSSTEQPGIAGVARVMRTAYPDHTALDPESPYFDERSATQGSSRWLMVDVKAEGRFRKPITLKQMRAMPELATMALLRPGQRLSVQPVTAEEWEIIMTLSPLDPI